MGEETIINQVVRRVKGMSDDNNQNGNINVNTLAKYLPLAAAIVAALMGYSKLQTQVDILIANAEKQEIRQEQRMNKLEDKLDKYIENCERQFRNLAKTEVIN